ncbi:MAG: hypothetical protein ABMA13_14295 [Chthoniobacteraceae bacterium]
MTQFFTALRATTLFYWTQPRASLTAIATMLVANLTLYSLCDYVRFDDDAVTAKGLVSLGAFVIIYVAGTLAMLRPGAQFPDDAFNLAWTVLMAWQIAVALFALNLFPALRLYDVFALDPWQTGAIYGAAGTGTLLWFSLFGIGNQPNPRPRWVTLILPTIVTFGLTTILISQFLMDNDTRQYVLARTTKFDKVLKNFLPNLEKKEEDQSAPTPTGN